MPKLPPILYTNWISDIGSHINLVTEYFQIPSFHDVHTHTSTAIEDSVVAIKSIYACVTITTKPLCILIGLVSHYLCIVLKLLADCTIQHAIIALKECWKQAYFAFNWFVQFQSGLSRTAKLIEIGVVCLLILLCAIQRYIKKKKYVERILNWHGRKRKAMLMKYENFVDNVAQTSMVLALLLPHILYLLGFVSVNYVAPKLVRYLATKTILTSVISIYYPIFKTGILIHQWLDMSSLMKRESEINNDTASSSKRNEKNERRGIMSIFNRKTGIADKYLEAASSSAPQNAKKEIVLLDKQKISNRSCSSEEDMMIKEVSYMLKYWSVHAFLSATFLILSLLPGIGRIISNQIKTDAYSSKQTNFSLLGRLYFSKEFFEEVKLVFFVWLNLLSASKRNRSEKGDSYINHVKEKTQILEKNVQASQRMTIQKKMLPFTSQPLDILFERLSPLATSFVQSSSSFYRGKSNDSGDGNNTVQSIILRGISGFQSILDVLVWSKMLSDNRKCQILAIFMECLDLIPALTTLFMPSYFTSYGVIYVRLVVPASKSVYVLDELQRCTDNDDTKLKRNSIAGVIRYLRYWVIHFFLNSLLTSFSPILDWVPFVTHMKWVFWAYIHLESSTLHLYSFLTYELMAFGLLKKIDDEVELDINNTMVVNMLQSICERLPSAVTQDDTPDQLREIEDNKDVIETKTSSQIATTPTSEKSISENNSDMSGLSTESSEVVKHSSGISKEVPCAEDLCMRLPSVAIKDDTPDQLREIEDNTDVIETEISSHVATTPTIEKSISEDNSDMSGLSTESSEVVKDSSGISKGVPCGEDCDMSGLSMQSTDSSVDISFTGK